MAEKEAGTVVCAHGAARNEKLLVAAAVVLLAGVEDAWNQLLHHVFVILLMPLHLILMVPVAGEEGLLIQGVAGPNLQFAGIDKLRESLNHAGVLILVKTPQ
ncbi:hypothetical protein D3C73_1197100 [compost metagenome]